MKNCLIVLVDSLRYDAIETHGKEGLLEEMGVREWLETPSLNQLVKRGTRVPNLHAPYPATPPSTASLLTGLYPREHHLYGFRRVLHPDVPTLADYFRETGFHTILQNGHTLFSQNGIANRFDEHLKGPLPVIVKRIQEENDRGKRVFAYVHSFDAHRPYLMSKYPPNPGYHRKAVEVANKLTSLFGDQNTFDLDDAHRRTPEKSYPLKSDHREPVYQYLLDVHKHYASEKATQYDMPKLLARLYAMGVSHFDRHQLQPVVEFLRDSDSGRDTMFFLTGDHGETLRYDSGHKTFYHGGMPSEDLIRVPGLLVGPNRSNAETLSRDLTSLVDVAPTILNQFEMSRDEGSFSGHDWYGAAPDSRCVFSEVCLTVQHPEKEFPLNSVLTWNSIIRSDGFKYYRKGLEVTETDFRRPLREFIRIVLQKLEFIRADDSFVQPYVEKLSPNDSLKTRRSFVQRIKQESSPWDPQLYRWDEDPYETQNLLEEDEKRWEDLAKRLDRGLQSRFPEPQDLSTPLPEPADRDEEEVKEGLKGLGYL